MTNALSRTRRDHSLWDQRVNDLWGGHKPVLSPEETLAAARKLWRHATGKAWPGKWAVTSGRRHTWPRRGTFHVNPNRYGGGLRQVIHLIAHYAHRRLHPGDKPHSIRQLRLEAKLTKFAVARWGKDAPAPKVKAKPLPPKPSQREKAKRLVQLEARLKRRRAEMERAQRLLALAAKAYRDHRTTHFRWLDR